MYLFKERPRAREQLFCAVSLEIQETSNYGGVKSVIRW